MKVKTKLIASIMSICLVCAVFAIGVFALKTANLKIGGDVSFQATGVEATISNADLKTGTDGTTTMTKPTGFVTGGKIDTSMTQNEINQTFATWESLDFAFNEAGDDIIFSFNIKNDSTNANHYIEMDYDYSFASQTTNVDVFPLSTNNYIVAPGQTNTFGIIVRLISKQLDVSDLSLDVTIDLKHIEPVLLAEREYGNLLYSFSGETAYVEGYNTSVSEAYVAQVAPVVSDGTKNYVVTEINLFQAMFNEDMTEEIYANFSTMTIPNSVTNFTFRLGSVQNIIIPKSVVSVNFDSSTVSGSIVMENGALTTLSVMDTKMPTLEIPNCVPLETYGTFASENKIDKIILGYGLTKIGIGVFGGNFGAIEFKAQDGWSVNGDIMTETDMISFSASNIDVSDSEKNAELLTSGFYYFYCEWTREV